MIRAIVHCRRAQADGYLSVAHCLILNNLDPDTLKLVVVGELPVPGGYPEDWAKEHSAPFPPIAVEGGAGASNPAAAGSDPAAAPDVREEAEGRDSSSQSSHSACTDEHVDALCDPEAVTTAPAGNEPTASRKGKKKPLQRSIMSSNSNGELVDANIPRSSATGAAAVSVKDSVLAVAVPVKKATRSRARRSLGGKEVEQPALPVAGGAMACAWSKQSARQ